MKIALCFIISYEHILNKEELWREWIEHNKDIINIYFYYKDFKKIKSEWIKQHCIPQNFIYETSYFYVMPAYLSLMKYALTQDISNQWFCMLTDSCCPIISPKRFKYLFYKNYNKSILSWKKAWWNLQFHKRANLGLLPEVLRLANDPWFVMKRENVLQTLHFVNNQDKITSIVCSGGLANESLFAIIMYTYRQLDDLICSVSHTTDWSRRSSATSPHLFKHADELDIKFIDTSIEKDKYVMFIRKIDIEFPDDILRYYIYEHSKKNDETIILRKPFIFIYLRWKIYLCYGVPILIFLYMIKYFFIINTSI